ncbi:hypothetical protein EYF80_051871 [Liparis tanakae]|uniref:Secreted protein n=1 Tax=Liparis tanakae TaxID=230148 RepID=A0A4Z2FC42_9TELE|nr:hypothetical protein EYF80_051871 [Liparis tanakae]
MVRALALFMLKFLSVFWSATWGSPTSRSPVTISAFSLSFSDWGIRPKRMAESRAESESGEPLQNLRKDI